MRSYLIALTDPTALIDQDEIARLEQSCGLASDPIDKLKCLSNLERARVVDIARLERDFVRDVKAWADQEGVEVEAFRAFGVPEMVLAEAGLTAGSRSPSQHEGNPKSRTIRAEAIQRHILTIEGAFSRSDVASLAGGSPMTVRKAVDELVKSGRVRRLGPDLVHNGRGRAPVLYQVETNMDRPKALDRDSLALV